MLLLTVPQWLPAWLWESSQCLLHSTPGPSKPDSCFYTWPRSCQLSWASTVFPEDDALLPSCLHGKNAFSMSVLLVKSFFFQSRIEVHPSSALPPCQASPCSQSSSPLSTPMTVSLWSCTYSMGFFPRHTHFLAAATMSSRVYFLGLAR